MRAAHRAPGIAAPAGAPGEYLRPGPVPDGRISRHSSREPSPSRRQDRCGPPPAMRSAASAEALPQKGSPPAGAAAGSAPNSAAGHPVSLPIFLFSLGSAAHRSLVGYKSAPSSAGRSARRNAPRDGDVWSFFEATSDCVLRSCRPSALIVPGALDHRRASLLGRSSPCRRSRRGRPRPPPRRHRSRRCRSPPCRGAAASAVPPRGSTPVRDGFEVLPGAVEIVRGATVIVLDDIFTSGARALSAAAAAHSRRRRRCRRRADRPARPAGAQIRQRQHSRPHWSGVPWQPGGAQPAGRRRSSSPVGSGAGGRRQAGRLRSVRGGVRPGGRNTSSASLP